ncbi:hypothetical protein ACFYP4_28750 [Streptomyces sp. NPDC005551]|uniref:hypothetical protein n=1 Tax=unclassified Streptomyces TaxID=2593676 RepID=UPI0033E3529E
MTGRAPRQGRDRGRDHRSGNGRSLRTEPGAPPAVCDGKPAAHAVSTGYTYDNLLESQALPALFHAYVDDITERRRRTHVTYLAPKDFRNH